MLPVLIGDGKAMDLTVFIKAVVDLPPIPLIVRISTVRVKVTLTKNAKNTVMLKEKNSIVTNSRNIAARKGKLKGKISIMQKPVNKKWNKPRMPIGLLCEFGI